MSSPTPSQGIAKLGEVVVGSAAAATPAGSPDPLKPLYISLDENTDHTDDNTERSNRLPGARPTVSTSHEVRSTNEVVSTAAATSLAAKEARTSESTLTMGRRPPFGCAICDRFASTDIDELEGHINAHRMDLVRHLHLHPVPEAVELATQARQHGQSLNGASRASEWRRPDLARTSYRVLASRNNSFKQRSIHPGPIGSTVHYTSDSRAGAQQLAPTPSIYTPSGAEHHRSSVSYEAAAAAAAAFQHSPQFEAFLDHGQSDTAAEVRSAGLPPFHATFAERKRPQQSQPVYQQQAEQWHRPLEHTSPGPSSSWLLQGHIEEEAAWAAGSERDSAVRQSAEQAQRVDQLPGNSADVAEPVVKLEYHELQPSMSGLDHFTIDTAASEDASNYSSDVAAEWSFGDNGNSPSNNTNNNNNCNNNNNNSTSSRSSNNNNSNNSATAANQRQVWWPAEQQHSAARSLSPTTSGGGGGGGSRWDAHDMRQFHQAWTSPKVVICQQYDWELEPKRYCFTKPDKPRRPPPTEAKCDSGSTSAAKGMLAGSDKTGCRGAATNSVGPVEMKRRKSLGDVGGAPPSVNVSSSSNNSDSASVERKGPVTSARMLEKTEGGDGGGGGAGDPSDGPSKQLRGRAGTQSKSSAEGSFTSKVDTLLKYGNKLPPAETTAIAVKTPAYVRLANSVKAQSDPNKIVVVATKSNRMKKLCSGGVSNGRITQSAPRVSESTTVKTNPSGAGAPRRSTRLQGRPSRRFGVRAAYH